MFHSVMDNALFGKMLLRLVLTMQHFAKMLHHQLAMRILKLMSVSRSRSG